MTIGPVETVVNPEHAHLRLRHLYEISKLFARFENIEQTLDPALGIAAQTLHLRSAVLTEVDGTCPTRIVWASNDQSVEQLQAVKAHVETAHSYLVGSASAAVVDFRERSGKTALPRAAQIDEAFAKRFIILPLVVSKRPPFGTLAVEGARTLDKADLLFVNAIVNQLAIALDRDHARQRDIGGRQQAEAALRRAEAIGVAAERQRVVAEDLRQKSERLAAENALLYQQAQLAIRMREQVLTIVSHDLKNPLATILLTADVLSRRGVPEERRRGLPLAVGRLRRAADRMLRLIDDLLDFASIETGRLAIDCEPQYPGPIIEETLTSFESTAHAKQIHLSCEIQSDLPQILCDRDRVLQVLSNLLSNAIKVSPEGGNITLLAEAHGAEVRFTVSDDGPGISRDDFQHLFERYWRSEDVGYKGTGLGLAIARGIVDAHGGNIWVESEPGHGATFRFSVPNVENRPSSEAPNRRAFIGPLLGKAARTLSKP
ncbi:MAG TPA: GAF domain-containing sensor histidine kinase [Polyangia bacterium]|nr:GAF domain-containing sensor histidine kinase [Polyangia bacterium]